MLLTGEEGPVARTRQHASHVCASCNDTWFWFLFERESAEVNNCTLVR